MNRRCVNNLQGYCNDTPRCKQSVLSLDAHHPEVGVVLNVYEIGACAQEGAPCIHFRTWSEELMGVKKL